MIIFVQLERHVHFMADLKILILILSNCIIFFVMPGRKKQLSSEMAHTPDQTCKSFRHFTQQRDKFSDFSSDS